MSSEEWWWQTILLIITLCLVILWKRFCDVVSMITSNSMTHEIFSTPVMLTENVVDKAGFGKGVNSFSQIRVFSGVLRCGGEQLVLSVKKIDTMGTKDKS